MVQVGGRLSSDTLISTFFVDMTSSLKVLDFKSMIFPGSVLLVTPLFLRGALVEIAIHPEC